MSYFVSQRTQEIGIRMALGATSRDVLRAVLVHGARVVGAGILAGLAAAQALTRSMQAFLFGVTPDDPLTFVIASALLAVAGVLACYVPARRATHVTPVIALRAE
jgi:ABC-type antimicrobial peptide transport system permease subunit